MLLMRARDHHRRRLRGRASLAARFDARTWSSLDATAAGASCRLAACCDGCSRESDSMAHCPPARTVAEHGQAVWRGLAMRLAHRQYDEDIPLHTKHKFPAAAVLCIQGI